MPSGIGTSEVLIIALLILVLFGAKRLPDAARALGRSARILKAETRGLHDDASSKSLQTSAEPPVARFDPVTGQPVGRVDPLDARPAPPDRLT